MGAALRGLQQQLIPRGVPERVADQPQTLDVEQRNGDPLPPACADFPQHPVELIHEIAPVRQPREDIVIACVVEAALQVLALRDLIDQPLIDDMQAIAGGSESAARTLEAVGQIVHAEGHGPHQQRHQSELRGQLSCRIPTGAWTDGERQEGSRSGGRGGRTGLANRARDGLREGARL